MTALGAVAVGGYATTTMISCASTRAVERSIFTESFIDLCLCGEQICLPRVQYCNVARARWNARSVESVGLESANKSGKTDELQHHDVPIPL